MPARKMRVEVFDEQGNRYKITFEGEVTREKALRLLDIVELLGGVHSGEKSKESIVETTKFDKAKSIVEKYFRFTHFSSKQVFAMYKQEFDEPISLSTISTYLARMAERGFVVRQGPTHKRTYLMVAKLAQNSVTNMKDK